MEGMCEYERCDTEIGCSRKVGIQRRAWTAHHDDIEPGNRDGYNAGDGLRDLQRRCLSGEMRSTKNSRDRARQTWTSIVPCIVHYPSSHQPTD